MINFLLRKNYINAYLGFKPTGHNCFLCLRRWLNWSRLYVGFIYIQMRLLLQQQQKNMVAWDKVCVPNSAEGLKILNVTIWISDSICKLLWTLSQKRRSSESFGSIRTKYRARIGWLWTSQNRLHGWLGRYCKCGNIDN